MIITRAVATHWSPMKIRPFDSDHASSLLPSLAVSPLCKVKQAIDERSALNITARAVVVHYFASHSLKRSFALVRLAPQNW